MKIMLKIYLTNLGKYNEGQLIGEWVDLPISDDDLEVVKQRIGISDEPDENGNYYEEWFVTDYETDIHGLKVGEYDNLDELNELAETLDSLDEYEREIVEAMISEGYSLDDALDGKDDCMMYYNCEDMKDVAKEYAEETRLLDSIPENLQSYFDFEAYGRDMSFEGHFVFTDKGNCVQIL